MVPDSGHGKKGYHLCGCSLMFHLAKNTLYDDVIVMVFLPLCSFYLEDSSPGLQQRAHSVPTSYYSVEETPRSTTGLQYPWREGFTAGNLYFQGWGVRSTGIPTDFI